MEDYQASILFMDDEPHTEPVELAVSRLREEGYQVDFVLSMSEAIEAYYQKFYEIFILDIDMSHVQDSQEGDGVQVLKHFISLHNKTKVILFSGAGTVQHWFAAANAHCYAYIAKDEPDYIERLLQWVDQGTKEDSSPTFKAISKSDCPTRVLCCCEQEDWMEMVRERVNSTLGQHWEIEHQDNLEDIAARLSESLQYFGIVLLIKEVFELWPRDKNVVANILAYGPQPQVIVACKGGKENELRSSILFLSNNHPFRMLNIDDPVQEEQLGRYLEQAATWYGRREIFRADSQALARMHITLPEDENDLWDDFDPDMSDPELYGRDI